MCCLKKIATKKIVYIVIEEFRRLAKTHQNVNTYTKLHSEPTEKKT